MRLASLDCARMLALLRRLSASQLAFLFSEKLYDAIQVVSHSTKSVRQAGPEDISWPTAFTLSCFHHSHRHASRALPKWNAIATSLDHLNRRLAWRWHQRPNRNDNPFAPKHLLAPYVGPVLPAAFQYFKYGAFRILRHSFNSIVGRCILG